MQAQVITFNCVLKNKAGQLISSTYNRDVLTIGGFNMEGILSGLNKRLHDLKKGEKRIITVQAEEAYGLYDPNKVILFPRRKLPRDIKKGESLQIVSKTGVKRSYKVLELHSDFVSLDGNHPLAGQDLVFEIDAIEARSATQKEIDDSINPLARQLLH